MPSFPERVADEAADIKLIRLFLTLLAVPFYAVGLAAGLVWVALRWTFAAVAVGFADVTDRKRVSDDVG